jgi:hypothetical protein
MSEKRTVTARYITKGEPYVRVKLSDKTVMREHRFVMEEELGRRLDSSEHVHHKDENKRRNDPGNLDLTTLSDHSKHHAPHAPMVRLRCRVCGTEFERKDRYVRSKRKTGASTLYCSNACSRRGTSAARGIVHGTSMAYNQNGCRCETCKEYKRQQNAAAKKRRESAA